MESGGDYCAIEEALNNLKNVNYKNSFGETALIIGKLAYLIKIIIFKYKFIIDKK